MTGVFQIHVAHGYSLAVAARMKDSRVRGLTGAGKAASCSTKLPINKKFLSIQQLGVWSIAYNRAFQ
jgi:hypothetical protein